MNVCRGSFSAVFLVRERKTGNFYALKCVKKKQLDHSNLENEITVLRRSENRTLDHHIHRTGRSRYHSSDCDAKCSVILAF